jgi:hypothetical protein
MNRQIRYGLAALVAMVLLGVITYAIGSSGSDGTAAVTLYAITGWGTVLAFLAGMALLITGLIRGGGSSASSPRQE